ncbi:MAG: hypothetical protein ACHQ9S_25650 [Candidatus Binatia bacterium]
MEHHESTGFILPGGNGLLFSDYGDGLFLMAGEIKCLGAIVVTVLKVLMAMDEDPKDPKVMTIAYSYNAKVEGRGNIVRYDSPHAPTHNPFHHVHRYDVFAEAGDDQGTVGEIKDGDQPTIGGLLAELEVFYYQNIERLPKV